MFYDLPVAAPEIKQYRLGNYYLDGFVIIVTDHDLKSRFSESELTKLYSNRYNQFFLEEIFYD